MTLNGTAHTFGFELEPDAFEVDNFVAEFYHNGSPVFSFDQDVDGNGGARLFAATGGDFDQVVITSSGGDFALAQFRVGGDISTVPEPSTMGLIATGLVGMGGLGRFRRRRRA